MSSDDKTVECPHCGEQHNSDELEEFVERTGETPCCSESISLVETSVEEL